MFLKAAFARSKQTTQPPSTKEEEEHFLCDNSSHCSHKPGVHKVGIQPKERIFWLLLNVLLTTLFGFAWFLNKDLSLKDSYEHGFRTDLQPAKPAIELIETEFYGGIVVNSTGDFNLVLKPDEECYVGIPTRELDAAWDRLVGSYIALNTKEAGYIDESLSLENGAYYVVPHVRHSLHCLNYLRKALYNHWYPTISTESRDHVPPYFMHVDHCIETLRETIQCNMDITPVPHVWSEEKGMFLAQTMSTHTCRDFDALVEWQDRRAKEREPRNRKA